METLPQRSAINDQRSASAWLRQYRFRPALQNGKPVPVKVNVEVNFRRY